MLTSAGAAELVNRDLTRRGPDELWVADPPYLRCWDGVVLFSSVLDAFSRGAIGRQLASQMRTTPVLDALRMSLGVERRPTRAAPRSPSQRV